jgi:hypothetical protein
MAGYDVYLGKTLLPIAPEKISMKINGKNKTYDLINDGEMNILKLAGLTTVSFTILLPAVQYPFATYTNGFKAPSYFLDALEALKQGKKPFQFIVTRKNDSMKGRIKLHNTNMTVSLEDYSVRDEAKEGFDIKVEVNLKQYKEFSTKTFYVENPSPTAPIAITPQRPPSTSQPESQKPTTGGSSKKYKVQIPGMGVVEVTATSVQDAITKASGSTWTGTIYVDGKSYTVTKGKLDTPITTAAKNVAKVVKKVVDTVKNVATTIATGLKNLFSTKQQNTATTVKKPAATKPKNGAMVLKQ